MKRFMIVITLALLSGNVNAQQPRSGYQTRPQWNGYYNGRGVTPGYSYNPRSGWNTMHTPNGNWMHYRDGYVPMRPDYRYRRYNQPYYYGGGSYSDIMEGFIDGGGW